MTAAVHIVPDALQGQARHAILEALRAETRAVVDGGRRPLILSVREDDVFIGGLVGQTFMGWLAVDALWVSARHRNSGHATALMAQAEDEARRRGARDCMLDTFSFQAPAFYRKLGYRDFARLDDFPAGHCRHFMTKTL